MHLGEPRPVDSDAAPTCASTCAHTVSAAFGSAWQPPTVRDDRTSHRVPGAYERAIRRYVRPMPVRLAAYLVPRTVYGPRRGQPQRPPVVPNRARLPTTTPTMRAVSSEDTGESPLRLHKT